MDLYYGEMDSFMETYGAEANWDNLGDWMSESNFVDCTSPDGAFDYFASWYGKGDQFAAIADESIPAVDCFDELCYDILAPGASLYHVWW